MERLIWIRITYSTTQGGYARTGNLSFDPKFVSPVVEGFKVPVLGDVVIIDANHIVTINANATAKSIEYRATGQVEFKTTAAQLNVGF